MSPPTRRLPRPRTSCLSARIRRDGRFWFRLHEAWKSGWADELLSALGSMKVCFVFCASEEACESKKWELANRMDSLAECAVLRGWKRLLGVVHVKTQLASWCKEVQ